MSPGEPLPLFNFIGFTGHRSLARPEIIQRRIDEALRNITARFAGVEWVTVPSVAEGADVLFVRTALDQMLPWHAILPFFPAEFQKDFDPAAWQSVEKLLDQAAEKFTVVGTNDRVEAYLDAGLETVGGADILIAVWDGAAAQPGEPPAVLVELMRKADGAAPHGSGAGSARPSGPLPCSRSPAPRPTRSPTPSRPRTSRRRSSASSSSSSPSACRRQAALTHSWNSVAKAVSETEHALRNGVVEWHSIARYRESP
ncbi:MAG: hypothetical protein C0502_05805 [Opitutus sp.]|nr:hypothetical protein [Opitutus sp.]